MRAVYIVLISTKRTMCLDCLDNNIGVLGAQSIGESLKSLTTLKSLNLSGELYVWCMMCVIRHWAFVMFRKQHWRCWGTIDWRWPQITDINDIFEFVWWEEIELCDIWHMLSKLCLWFDWNTENKIGDIGAKSIGEGLKSLASLETLDLRCLWFILIYNNSFVFVVFCIC